MKLNLIGNMPLYLPRDPQSAMEAATKNYVDRTVDTHAEDTSIHMTAAQNEWLDAITVTAAEINAIGGIGGNIAEQLELKLDKTGGTLSGGLYLHADPVDANQASTKNYVDLETAKKVAKAGDTMSGFLTLHADPENAMHAAPRQFVTTTVSAHTDNDDLHVPANKVDFLANVTATAGEVNNLVGVSGNVQTQLDSKFAKTGGTVTGPIQLHADPTENLQAATKQYVDNQDATKLNKAGGTMTGPIVLSANPTENLQAAPKQYVDTTVATHADNEALHLTTAQNELLDSLTVTAEDLNKVAGLTDSVTNLLATKLDKSGGNMTGDVTFTEGKTIFVNKTPEGETELVNKAYVDAKFQGQEWRNPVTGINLVSATTSTPPAVPVESDIYIVGSGATGDWTAKEGYAAVYTEGVWKFLQERPVMVGDRFGVALRSATALTTELDTYGKLLVTITDATVGAMTFEADANTASSTTLVFDQDAPDFGVTYTFNDDGVWVPTNTSVNLTPGAALVLDGSTLNVTTSSGIVVDEANSLQVSLLEDGGLKFAAGGEIEVGYNALELSRVAGQLGLNTAVTAKIDGAVQKTGTSTVTGTVTISAGGGLKMTPAPVDDLDVTNKVYVDTADQALRTDVTTLQGTVATLNTDPVSKTYVDDQDATKLPLAGGTLTGPVQLHADPSSALQAATKQYVDKGITDHAADDALHLTSGQSALLDAVTVTAQEINHLNGVTDDVQTQLNDRLPLGGGTMAGPIVLNGEPAAASHATNKGYVDNQVASRLATAGGTMTGPIVLAADPAQPLQAATKQYVDNGLTTHVNNDAAHMTVDQNAFLDAVTVTATEVNQLAGVTTPVQTQLTAKLDKAGGTMTGALTLVGAPTTDLQAATKLYVDNNTTNKLPLAGGTLTGPLLLSGAPVADTEAATKKFVDDSITASTATLTADVGNRVAKAGDTMTGFLNLHSVPTADMHAATKKFVDDSIIDSEAQTNAQFDTVDASISTLNTNVAELMLDPVTKNYVNTQDAGRIAKAGDTMTGFLTLHNDPQSPMHAVPKQYVDAVAQGLKTKPAVRLATTENLSGIYNNGTAGVSATLTASSNGTLTVDGITPVVGDRVLLRMQDNKLQNGDYVVQQLGNGVTPFILKRVVTADESAEIPGAYFYTFDGLSLKGTGWAMVVDNPVTFSIGTDDIIVNQFSGQGSIIAGDGMILTGNTLDIRTADPTRITITADAIDLTPTGVTPGSYTKVVVDGYGRVSTGSNPTSLAGYGINDAQPLNQTLTNLSGLTTKGLVTLDAAGNAQTRKVGVEGTGLSIANDDGGTGDIIITSNATDSATAGTMVARDASGNFSANVVTAALTGNASSATVLKDSRNFSITGDVTADPQSFNGNGNVVLASVLSATGVTAGTYTQVTVDDKGRITLGNNPTTVEGYGIIDAATITYVNDKVAALEARMDELHMYVMSRM